MPPASVGPPDAAPGDPDGVSLLESEPAPPNRAAAGDHAVAVGRLAGGVVAARVGTASPALTDMAWACIDLNARALATMPPYLVDAAPTIDAGWLTQPGPGHLLQLGELRKQLFWDWYAVGEVFVLATARYSTGWPARFHVVAAVARRGRHGRRAAAATGSARRLDVPAATCCTCATRTRPTTRTATARWRRAGRPLIGAEVLGRYATTIAANGLIPHSILESPEEMSPDQAADAARRLGRRSGPPTPATRPSSPAG